MPANDHPLLVSLNEAYTAIHKQYEELFWRSYMGDHSVDKAFDTANFSREKFRANKDLYTQVCDELKSTNTKYREAFLQWKRFFETYQISDDALAMKKKIIALETKVQNKRKQRKEGYTDPISKKHITASENQMRSMLISNDDERVRKACFVALEQLALECVDEFIELVQLRNEFAQTLGYTDFYAYKIYSEEQMTKETLFSLFDTIYENTKYAFQNIREKEKTKKGLRKPWNRGYMLSGSFIHEEDQFAPFESALLRWGRSFAALGVDMANGTLQLDLLDRKGKYNNGFCHWPDVVHIRGGKLIPGSANFTCTLVPGQVGEGDHAYNTLFHEGGHAAHVLNSHEAQACVNTEYPPSSTAWAETQSMFMDSIYSSIDWKIRYATAPDGTEYPFSLFERKVNELQELRPLELMGITMVMRFEKTMYEAKKLTPEMVITTARKTFLECTDASESSVRVLGVPHIYSWESACSYHGYGLALLAVYQWREYFYKKYGYIVDNRNVGKEMKKVWKYGFSKSFPELVSLATGKKLSPKSYLTSVTRSPRATILEAKKKLQQLSSVKKFTRKVDLNGTVRMVHGKEIICDNSISFEDMSEKYEKWLQKQSKAK